MTQSVVIIAPEDDMHAQVVVKRLDSLGGRAIILDSALFPSKWRLTVRVSNSESTRFVLDCDGMILNYDELAGVWWRRPRMHIAPSNIGESHLRQFIVNESREAFEGWLHCLGNKVINPIGADLAASHKLLQLQYATEFDLEIPKTLATNSPQMVKSFYEESETNTVFKPFTGATWQFIGTKRLTAGDLGHLDYVTYSPVIFQEEVKKIADIRVNIIDGEVFSLIIRSKRRDNPLDWRIDPDREYASHKLPEKVASALIALVSKLSLRFGACDLALTEDDRYVFFEVNPGGQWLFAEIMTGQKLSWAFAKALLRPPNM